MRTIKYFAFCLLLMLGAQLTTNAQTVYTDVHPNWSIAISYEKLDVSQYRNKYSNGVLDYHYTKSDGTKVRVSSYRRGTTFEVFEYPPLPYIYCLYKEFYANGNLKQKGILLPFQVKVGKWLECDQRGESTVVDYEAYRNKFSYNDILKSLEQAGYYNAGDYSWTFRFSYTLATNQWSVRISRNNIHYRRLIYDGNTGTLLKEEDLTI